MMVCRNKDQYLRSFGIAILILPVMYVTGFFAIYYLFISLQTSLMFLLIDYTLLSISMRLFKTSFEQLHGCTRDPNMGYALELMELSEKNNPVIQYITRIPVHLKTPLILYIIYLAISNVIS